MLQLRILCILPDDLQEQHNQSLHKNLDRLHGGGRSCSLGPESTQKSGLTAGTHTVSAGC